MSRVNIAGWKSRCLHVACVVMLVAFMVLIFVLPASAAIASPDSSILIKDVAAFTNLWLQGDMLFVVSYDIPYAAIPTEDAGDYFEVIVYDTDKISMLGRMDVIDYNYRLASVYFYPYDVTNRAMVQKAAYRIQVSGTAVGFPGGVPTPAIRDLAVNDWFTGTALETREDVSTEVLRMMKAIQTHDNAVFGNITYLIKDAKSNDILSETEQNPASGLHWSGKSMVLAAIQYLDNICPTTFEGAQQGANIKTVVGTGELQKQSTMTARLGTSFVNAFAGIGTYFGISTQWAAAIFWSIIMSIAAMIVFVYSGNSLAAIILVFPLLLMGNWLGIVPIVVTFALTMLLVIYMAYHIYLRGLV